MKVSITAVLATLAASTLAADCRREGGSSYRYVITADGVDDIRKWSPPPPPRLGSRTHPYTRYQMALIIITGNTSYLLFFL